MAYLDTGGSRSGGAAGSAVRRSTRSVRRAGSSAPRRTYSSGAVARRVSSRSSGGGGGGSVRSYSAPRVSASSSGRYSAPAPPPAARAGGVPSIKNFLGRDTGYLQGNRQLAKSLADFLADVGRRRNQLTTEFGLSNKALQDQSVRDLEGIEEDYGSRGLLKSGLYTDAVGDYNTELNERIADLQRQQSQALTGLNTESSKFKSQQGLSRQALREAAIRRRAEQYGL